MERPRSFMSLARRITGSGKPPTLTTTTTSAAPTAVAAPAEPTTAPASATPTTAPASARPTTAPAPAKATTVLASARSTIVPASARPTTVPPSEPRDTSSARKTTTTAKGSRLPYATRTDVVAALPALPAPLPSDYDAKKAAKGKGHEGDDRKRSSDRDDATDVDREPKRARARSASPPRRVSRSVFQNKAFASSLFSTLVFHNDVVAPINTESSGDMIRQGLKFLALVNKVGHELESEVEDLKRKLEDETHRTENARTAVNGFRVERDAARASIDKKNNELTDQAREIASLKAEARKSANDLLTEVERSAIALAAAVFGRHRDEASPSKLEDELASLTADVAEHAEDEERFEQLITSLHGLLHVLDPQAKVPTVVAHDRTLETYAASVGVADPSGSILGGVGSRKDAVVGVDGKFSLIGGVGAEVTKSRIEDVAKDAGTVGAPEEMRMDEDSQGPRINVLTEDPRLAMSLERQRPRGRRSLRFCASVSGFTAYVLDIDFDFAPRWLPYVFRLEVFFGFDVLPSGRVLSMDDFRMILG
ncbi:hypothetical protein AALP_AA1G344900 [Arabis alpina]|uniref:Uncharacterized protein n=1 Tax=Arabis alpina TaxID=50452 RepID=A0A087HSK2_ARAAL|nr:hypothetical protein AALP_AA1G344900 [Arabis alpina]